jgi:hypothetical protein
MNTAQHLNEVYREFGFGPDQAAPLTLAQVRFGAVQVELRRNNNCVIAAARSLGVSRSKVYSHRYKLIKLTRGLAALLFSLRLCVSAVEFSPPPEPVTNYLPPSPIDLKRVQMFQVVRSVTHPRTNFSGVIRLDVYSNATPDMVISNRTTATATHVGTSLPVTLGGISVGTNTFIAVNLAGQGNQLTAPVTADAGRLTMRIKSFEIVCPVAGTLQVASNLAPMTIYRDVRSVTNGEAVEIPAHQSAAFFRVRKS